MLRLYRGATVAAGPLIGLYLRRRRARGKEDPARFGERFGVAGRARPEGPLLWAHAASVGESVSALPLIERLLARRADLSALVTTGTVTSARLMAERLPARAIHQFAPIDRPDAVARFFDHWRPDLALWIESEFWPNLMAEAWRRGVPAALVNARMSERSFSRWRRMRGLIAPLLAGFEVCLAQNEAEAARLRALGARRVETPGNIKAAAAPLPADAAALAALRAATAGRPLWLAASTHPGEEAMVAEAHRAIAEAHPGLLTIVAPRHPERGPAVAEIFAAAGLAVARRAAGEPIAPETAVYVADTLGELGLFYRLAEVVFVGGSLIPHGGHNLLEPARLGCALIHGPHMMNFLDDARTFADREAAERVSDAAALARAARALLADSAMRRRRMDAAGRIAAEGGRVIERIEGALAPLLDRLAPFSENGDARP